MAATPGHATLSTSGEIDITNAGLITGVVTAQLSRGHRHLRLDLAYRTTDPDLFFPVSLAGPASAQAAAAKAICRRCPVRQPCLASALDHQAEGIWSGTTGPERQALRPAPATPLSPQHHQRART